MPGPTLLVIDDEPQIRRVVRNAFKDSGTRVLEAATGAQGIDLAAAERPDLIVLDLGLPDMPGAEVCREIRRWSVSPILVLSARHSEEEKVRLLDAGADDYVTKPFSTSELQARARALLRRVQGRGTGGEPRIEIGGLTLDLVARSLTCDGKQIHLTPIEWDLLREMMVNTGRTLTHHHLFNQVWRGRQFGNAQQYLRVHVAHLRRKIETDSIRPRYIHTEPGELSLDVQPGLPRVAGDKVRLQEALERLLRYLVRHATPGSSLAIAMASTEGRVVLSAEGGRPLTLDADVALARRIIQAHKGSLEDQAGRTLVTFPALGPPGRP